MIWRKILNRLTGKKTGVLIYVVEVSLIIVSILVAIQADRYQQNKRNEIKLDNYIQSMYQDLLKDHDRNQNNLADCQNDIKNIERSLRLSQINQDDSLSLALRNLGVVFTRGVFRAFPPTTFDIMLQSGDAALIRDLDFRNKLASAFSFREDYIKKDLLDFDIQTREMSKIMAQYGNLSCMFTSSELHACLRDREGFIENFHNDLFTFLRTAQVRAFHLQIAIQGFDKTIKEMEELYGFKQEEVAEETQ